MIFITLGSQKFQFNRLLETVDKLIEEKKIKESVFAQIGYSDYSPQNFKFKKFLDRDEFVKFMDLSDLVITHGGTGAIINAVKKEKKVIATPRLSKYGEHVDNHQIQIIEQFDELGIIEPCYDLNDLELKIKKVNLKTYKSYVSNTKNIIESIESFLVDEKK